jgi:hypothetical protein
MMTSVTTRVQQESLTAGTGSKETAIGRMGISNARWKLHPRQKNVPASIHIEVQWKPRVQSAQKLSCTPQQTFCLNLSINRSISCGKHSSDNPFHEAVSSHSHRSSQAGRHDGTCPRGDPQRADRVQVVLCRRGDGRQQERLAVVGEARRDVVRQTASELIQRMRASPTILPGLVNDPRARKL